MMKITGSSSEAPEDDPEKDSNMEVTSMDASREPTNDDEEEQCPLFMDGLPSDFSTNPSLAALASLLDDDDNPKKEDSRIDSTVQVTTKPAAGGGKVRRAPNRSQRKNEPYKRGKSASKNSSATVGEANLFLKMWKL